MTSLHLPSLLCGLLGGALVATLWLQSKLEALRARSAQELSDARRALGDAGQRAVSLEAQRDAWERELSECRRTCEDLSQRDNIRDQALRETSEQLARAKEEAAAQQERLRTLPQLQAELQNARSHSEEVRRELGEQQKRFVSLETQLLEERKAMADKLATYKELGVQLDDKFKGIAAQVLQANTEKFETSTKQRLGEMSEALRAQVKALQDKVEQSHARDANDRIALRTELQNMVELSKRIDQDATQLARALKGDRRAQGAWGELVLETLLAQCGLREGVEYTRQTTFVDDDDRRLRPDVIVNMPGKGSAVIDAKVSLTAYSEYINADDECAAVAAIERHLISLRTHIKGLSEKDYWSLNGLNTAGDYVLLFVPVESAFADALRNCPELFEEAYRKHIILTSPTTLLATLRTIEHTWRVERQNETARSIAEEAGKLYDRFCAFVEDLQNVGMRINQAHAAYEGALKKLSTGRGNLVRQASKIQELGVQVKKRLPQELVDACEDPRVESLSSPS